MDKEGSKTNWKLSPLNQYLPKLLDWLHANDLFHCNTGYFLAAGDPDSQSDPRIPRRHVMTQQREGAKYVYEVATEITDKRVGKWQSSLKSTERVIPKLQEETRPGAVENQTDKDLGNSSPGNSSPP